MEDPDGFAFVKHRDGEFRTRFRIDHQITRIDGDVGSKHRFAQSGGRSNDSFTGGNAEFALNPLAVLDIQTVTKDFLFFVVEQDAKDLIVDHALDEFGGAAQQFFDVKDGADFAADLVQQKKRFGLRADAFKEPCVFNGNRQATAKQGQNVLLVAGEIIQMIALDIEDADALALKHQGDGKLGSNAIDCVDITGIFADVADAHRVAGGRSGSGNSLPKRYAEIIGQVARIYDGEARL